MYFRGFVFFSSSNINYNRTVNFIETFFYNLKPLLKLSQPLRKKQHFLNYFLLAEFFEGVGGRPTSLTICI